MSTEYADADNIQAEAEHASRWQVLRSRAYLLLWAADLFTVPTLTP